MVFIGAKRKSIPDNKRKNSQLGHSLEQRAKHVDNLKKPWMLHKAKRKIVTYLQWKENQLGYSLEKPTEIKNWYLHKKQPCSNTDKSNVGVWPSVWVKSGLFEVRHGT